MEAFATDVCLTLLHSLWQAGILYLLFSLFNITSIVNPSAKRNMLMGMLLLQLILSIITFTIVSANISFGWIAYYRLPKSILSASFDTISVYAILLYTILVFYRIAVHISQYKRLLHFHRQQFIKPNADIRVFTQLKAAEMGIKKVHIWLTDQICTPFTYGFLKPCILLPVALVNQLNLPETEALIIHELTHIKNRDYILNYFVLLMETVFCFNPFIFLISRKIKLEREKSCDLQVLQYEYPSVLYAEALLKTALHRGNTYAWQMAAVSEKHQLLNRIKFFTLENNFSKMKKTFNPINYALMLFVAFMSILIIADDNNTGTGGNSNKIRFLMPSYSYHLPVNTEESNGISATSPVAETVNKTIANPRPSVAINTSTVPVPEVPEVAVEALQVNNTEPVSKQILIREQNPATGKISTYVFKSSYINGEWTAEPIFTVIENKADTCNENRVVEIKEFSTEQ